MRPLWRNRLLVLALLAALTAAYLASRERQVPAQQAAAKALLALSLDDVAGKPQALSQWQGKILVVNFWATWCPPCLHEIPGFSRLNRKFGANGVQFVGIGIDSADKIRDFANFAPVSYPLLIGMTETLALARALGNRTDGLPYTVVLARDGSLQQTRLGAWREEELEKLLADLTR